MTNSRKRQLGNVLIFGVSGPLVLAILVMAIIAWTQSAPGQGASIYYLIPLMLLAILAARIGSMMKAAPAAKQ
jgi:uncharacterized protein involved in response to NO